MEYLARSYVSANCGITVHAVFWWSWDGTAWVTQSVVSYWEKPSLTQRQRRLSYRLPSAIRAVTEPIGAGMSVDRTNTIEWNGNELSGWIMINGAPTKVSADRDTIHTHARGFNDALTWEINRHRVEIFEKLVPFFQRTATIQAQ
jgi:hypothetical protein